MYKNNCALPLPYPETDDIKKDTNIASLLYEAYAGKIGALNAVSDYIYQSLLYEGDAPAMSELFNCFAMTKMKHFKIIGRTILKLGADPKIKAQIRNTSTNTKIAPAERLFEHIKKNKELEQLTSSFYKKIIIHTQDKALICILNRLIVDNEHHISVLNEIIENL